MTTGKMVEKPAEYEEDDELESLLSLGTPGMNKNSDSTAVLQNKKVSWMEGIITREIEHIVFVVK